MGGTILHSDDLLVCIMDCFLDTRLAHAFDACAFDAKKKKGHATACRSSPHTLQCACSATMNRSADRPFAGTVVNLEFLWDPCAP